MSVQSLAQTWTWPDERPSLAPDWHGWHRPGTERLLGPIARDCDVIVELGSWLGVSARYWLDVAPRAVLVCVDHWQGDAGILGGEHAWRVEHAREQFLANLWDWRARIVPVCLPTVAGLLELAVHRVRPGLVYIDADHASEACLADLATAAWLFPAARIGGDDWDMDSVRLAVSLWAYHAGKVVQTDGNCWLVAG